MVFMAIRNAARPFERQQEMELSRVSHFDDPAN